MVDAPDFRLAGLSVWAIAREFEQSDDFWDGNWLSIRARVETFGAIVETIGPYVRNVELARFSDQLAILVRDLRGTAVLESIEPMLSTKVEIGVRGDVTVTVEITPDHPSQQHWFKFHVDQSYLAPTLLNCQRLLARYPLRGRWP